MITYIFVFLYFASLSTLIYFTYTEKRNLRLISKIITSLYFLFIAISSYLINNNNFNYFILIFFGLAFSFLGDIFLGIKHISKKMSTLLFLLGILCFSLTHIFFSIEFISLSALYLKDFIISSFLSLVLMSIIISNKKIYLNNMFIPLLIYDFLISFMFCKSLSLISNPLISTISLILIISGTTLFIVSDFILAFIYFYKDCPKILKPLNSFSYYSGQLLLALSILYI